MALAKVDVVYIATRDGKELKILGSCSGSLMLRVSLMIRVRFCSGWEYIKKIRFGSVPVPWWGSGSVWVLH